MLIEKDYCDLESTKALESLGMNVYTSFCGVEVLKHLSLYEAQKWLREEKGVVVLVHHLMTEEGDWEWKIPYRYSSKVMYHSYEEALSEGIKEAVKILNEK